MPSRNKQTKENKQAKNSERTKNDKDEHYLNQITLMNESCPSPEVLPARMVTSPAANMNGIQLPTSPSERQPETPQRPTNNANILMAPSKKIKKRRIRSDYVPRGLEF